ncbi:HU family DNA-binding protein [uncultured Rubinisphaera sp.]|uniref:HU family DNA-binding protein n=1 Tax=uncultured Rubinisphaera sp. TaxID=1678686 RepID=UPI0030D853C5
MAAKQEKPMSKTEILNSLAESTGLSRKEVSSVLDGMNDLIEQSLGKKGPGVFNMPGLFKIQVTRKPATKATTRANPFKPGEMMEVKAKPARNVVKVRPLKGLKDMV